MNKLTREIYLKKLIKNNGFTIKEFAQNRESIALRTVSEAEDYYSFLKGFDYVLDTIKYVFFH